LEGAHPRADVRLDVAGLSERQNPDHGGERHDPQPQRLFDFPPRFVHQIEVDSRHAAAIQTDARTNLDVVTKRGIPLGEDLPAAEVEHIVATLMRPFPAGLMTDVGPVVATPAFAGDDLEPAFERGRYHGTTIWSWQQAMLSAGIARQLERSDLTPGARHVLVQAASRLACALVEAHAIRGSELWSWSESGGGFRVEPFGQRQGDETESNAAQLWSTVHLASPQQCPEDPGMP